MKDGVVVEQAERGADPGRAARGVHASGCWRRFRAGTGAAADACGGATAFDGLVTPRSSTAALRQSGWHCAVTLRTARRGTRPAQKLQLNSRARAFAWAPNPETLSMSPRPFAHRPVGPALSRWCLVVAAAVLGGSGPLAFGDRADRLGRPAGKGCRHRTGTDGRRPDTMRRAGSPASTPRAPPELDPGRFSHVDPTCPERIARSRGWPPGAARPAPPTAPRVLQSARAPAQLSFFFKRG